MKSAHLSDVVKTIRVKNSVAAGQTAVQSDVVDTQGYDAIRFVALIGAITATGTVSMSIHESATDAHGSAVSGTAAAVSADTDDEKMLVSDRIKPTQRYVSCEITRGTANSEVDGIIAELYREREAPVTQDATVEALTKTVGA